MSFIDVKDFTTGLRNKLRTFLVNTDENVTVHGIVDSANGEVLGTKTEAKSTATDTTSASMMQVLKQVSASVQSLVTAIGSTAWDLGAGAIGTRTQRMALATDSAGVLPTYTSDQAASLAAPALRTVPQEVHIGEVGGKTVLFAVTPTLDTSAYGTGDVLFDRTQCNGIFRIADGTGVLQSIQVIDQDDNGVAIDFYIHTTNQTLGTANAAPSISDANAAELLGPFSIATGDYKDLGGVKVGKISNIGQPIKAVSGTDDLYISAVVTGTPTFTAAGIKLRIGVLLD